MNINIGKILIFSGIILIVLGLIFMGLGSKVSWVGRLPGDFLIKRENMIIYFPLTTGIILSAILSLILFIFYTRS